MNLEKLINILRRIRDAIRRCLSPSKPADNNTIPGDCEPSNAGVSSETEPDQSSGIRPEGSGQPSVPIENNKPPKTPQGRRGLRGKHNRQKPPDQEKTPPEAKPELICREVSNQWQIFLDFPQGPNANISQGESRLTPNSSGEYPLFDFAQTLIVNMAENGQNETIELFEGQNPLIFKMRKNWKGDGQQFKHVSNGYYIVFAPHEWQRKGNPPVELSGCADTKFSAHYFFLDDNSESDGFVECDPFCSQKRFSLEGERVMDDSDMGDLFVGTALGLTDTNNWQGVSWVRVGQESVGQWGENFKPNGKELTNVLANRAGWFYIRIYDDDVNKIDGFAFRRLLGLEKILIGGEQYSPENFIAPNASGHTKTTIQFVGSIRAESDNPPITVDVNNAAVVVPNPDTDKTQWRLIGDNGQIEASIHLPHIWWRMDSTGSESSTWRDTAYEMSRGQFYENRDALIVVRLPSMAREICVGFDSFSQYDGARKYTAKHNHNDGTKQAEFQLRDFSDHQEISKHSSEGSALRIQCGNVAFPIVRILADAPLPKPTPIQKRLLRPVTRNKRFSRAELSESGLTDADAVRLRIAVDRRRKTKHHANVGTLQKRKGDSHAN